MWIKLVWFSGSSEEYCLGTEIASAFELIQISGKVVADEYGGWSKYSIQHYLDKKMNFYSLNQIFSHESFLEIDRKVYNNILLWNSNWKFSSYRLLYLGIRFIWKTTTL